ncbi:hypothetical protein [Desulfothermobacter acidiphilus]|uniref:hypothetical protein n=1 Tax=Desulfothermobacter acidiphilus TaxID=1938353 RepID=UPI003F8ABFFD
MIKRLTAKEKEEAVKRIERRVMVIVTVVTLVAFWAGLYLLQHGVFRDYYDPHRHTIVEQDPETMLVYSWKDAEGHVFTRHSPTVRLFSYGIMVLLLGLMGVSAKLSSSLKGYYLAQLEQETVGTEPAYAREHRAY